MQTRSKKGREEETQPKDLTEDRQLTFNFYEEIERESTFEKSLRKWQIALRTGQPVQDRDNSDGAPDHCPEWAGGKGLPPVNRPLCFDEMEMIEEGYRSDQLRPYEAAILLGVPGWRIRELLDQLEGITLEPDPSWLPSWAHLQTISSPYLSYKETWSQREIHNLKHYWNQEILSIEDIATFLNKCPEETLMVAREIGLSEREQRKKVEWCGISWEFEPEKKGDPKYMDTETQRMVAEASAVRFSLLYEALETLEENQSAYRKIQKELDKIISLHERIFDKYITTKSRKYCQAGQTSSFRLTELKQVGKAAIFDCLRRWHPDKNIRFSRGAICIAITREMITWMEQQRIINLPDKVRAIARKLRLAEEEGRLDEEYDRLVAENGEDCVLRAHDHKNTYAFVSTVPLLDSYDEDEARFGAQVPFQMETVGDFEVLEKPEENFDILEIILEASKTLNQQEKRAIFAYYGITESGEYTAAKTLEEIGGMEGVTKERIRQRIVKGKEKMRKWMARKGIRRVADTLGC